MKLENVDIKDIKIIKSKIYKDLLLLRPLL